MNTTSRQSRLRERILHKYRALHDPLFADLVIVTKRIAGALELAKRTMSYTASLDQELKLLIRCFFAFVEGVTGVMREAITTPTLVKPELIAAKDLQELHRSDDAPVTRPQKKRRTATCQRVKLGLKYFPQAFGSAYQANFNPPGWPAFNRLVKLRNRITHPTRIEHLFPAEALTHFQPAANWFLKETEKEIALAVDSVFPRTTPNQRSSAPSLNFPEVMPAEAVFNSAFYDSVECSGANAIAYMRAVHKLLHEELSFSLDLVPGSQYGGAQGGRDAGFGLRCAVRSAVSVLEGIAGMVLLFTRAAVRRGELVVSEGELTAAECDTDPARQLRACLELYSRNFGTAQSIDTATDRWKGLERLVEQRHRLTHPGSPSDLLVTPATLGDLIHVIEVYTADIAEALSLEAQSN